MHGNVFAKNLKEVNLLMIKPKKINNREAM